MKLKLAENLRSLRLSRNITQEQLAEHLGISFKTVSRWETGSGYPDIEMLPMIADYFDTSLEDLLGVSKTDREQASKVMYDQLAALPYDSPERTKHLLKMNKEFPNDRAVLYSLCKITDDLTLKRHFTKEMIRTANTPKNGLDPHTARAIGWLIDAEEEENAQVLIQKYTQPLILARELRMESRAYAQKNIEQYDLERQKNLLISLLQIVFERMKIKEMPVMQKIEGLTSLLAVIDALTGTTGKRPVSGDGEPDLWFPIRFTNAQVLACYLASIDERERALSIIEDLADLHEKFWSLPNNTLLTFRSSVLDKMEAPVIHTKMSTLFAEDKDQMTRPARYLHVKQIDWHQVVWSYHTYRPYISTEWSGFDSIREEKRLKNCVERMRQTEKKDTV
ncbi:MAG: helix-turn-helix transcriptional regulator [Ruminococcaceae bacterium]|nr:helix-turn-helix transcriptional regulator [Oscillospiraceae bacterium]